MSLKNVKSQYKYVLGLLNDSGVVHWFVHKRGVARSGFKTEREAAIAADKYLISKGEKPVNILKKV